MAMINFQQKFFDRLFECYPKRSEAVDRIEEILGFTRDTIYRRIRCETILHPDELYQLAKAHNLSLDALMGMGPNQNEVVFIFNSFANKINSFEDFMETLIQTIQSIKYIHDGEVYYASSEIPVFYQTLLPHFFSFKLYVWARTAWNFQHFKNLPFDFNLIPKTVQLRYQEAFDLYKTLPSTELWSSGIFENTLSQIEHHLDANLFAEPRDAMKLLDELYNICEHMRAMAENGRKFSYGGSQEHGSPFLLYHNEMVHTNNTILFLSPSVKLLFSTICNPNFIMSRDQRICEFTHDWFKNIMSNSSMISHTNERMRNRFFDGISRKIDIMRKKTDLKIMEEY
jgi:hypothetical protein